MGPSCWNRPPNGLRISCGRKARSSEFYGPLIAIGDQGEAELARSAPASCMRGLGSRLEDGPRLGALQTQDIGLSHRRRRQPTA
jgi:hypothetical protein